MQCWLEISDGRQFPLQGTCTIGRMTDNTLALADIKVSRRHAIIHAQGGEYCLVDLGSRNGILLNGQRLRMPAPLKDNDRIEIASTVMVFRAAEPVFEEERESMATMTMTHAGKTSPCWMLVADICAFTQMSQQMPQDELAQKVGKWVLANQEVIEKTRGVINKYLGDGYLAFWPEEATPPAAIAETINALRQLQAGSAMPFRIVVHHGLVHLNGSLAQGEDNLIGAEVNYIFRMEKACGALNEFCLLSASAAEQLQPFLKISPQGAHALKGFNGEDQLFSC
jgi:adenylate cyclase